jgi:hypothetical protein
LREVEGDRRGVGVCLGGAACAFYGDAVEYRFDGEVDEDFAVWGFGAVVGECDRRGREGVPGARLEDEVAVGCPDEDAPAFR